MSRGVEEETKTILIVDDEQEVRDMLQEFLQLKHFKTVLVDNGTEAIEHMKKDLPDLVITDLLLPGEHGIDLIKTIGEDFFVPVIAMSGIYKEEEIQCVVDDECVKGFFTKPLDLKKLLKLIRSAL